MRSSFRQAIASIAPGMCVSHHPIELGARLSRSGYAQVYVLAGNVPAAALSVLPELRKLQFGVLTVECRNTRVEGDVANLLRRGNGGATAECSHVASSKSDQRGRSFGGPLLLFYLFPCLY
jgi:hypothetical protein